MVKHTILGAALVALLAVPAAAQKPVSIADVVSATFAIEAIDHNSRVVTLKKADGTTQDIYCGPDVQRFDALKVGDKVTFRSRDSMVSIIQRPGATPKPAVTARDAHARHPARRNDRQADDGRRHARGRR